MAVQRANQRSTESADDRLKRLVDQRNKRAVTRSLETPEQHARRLQQLKSKRDMESPAEHAERLQNIKAKRDMQPPEAYELRLQQMTARRDMKTSEERATNLLNLKARRIMESPEEHASRLHKQKEYREMETPEVHTTRLLNLKAKRYMESPEQHRARLDNQRAQRSLESREGRVMRLSTLQAKRKLESPEDRGVRLNAMKVQHAAQRSAESPEARSSRLGYLKAQRKALKMSETVEEREGRLERRRQGLQHVQEAKSNEVTASAAQCTALDDAGLLHECSKDMKSQILGELGFALGPSGMDQCVCCVCDRLAFATDVHVYSTEDKDILQSMAARLRNPDLKLSDELVAFYDCKDIHPAFVGLLLSRKGITHAGNVNDIENPRDIDFNICLECETVLLQPWLSELPRHYVFPGEPVDSERDIDHEFDDHDEHAIAYADQEACLYDDPTEDNDGGSIDALAEVEFPDFSEIPIESWPLPPKHAIANHFFVGELPDELFKATWAEMLMCSL
ncbi:hypothetical protein DYB26_014952, partial [Aphanomyces astaci]